MKINWSFDLGPMNIWCEVEEDNLKNALQSTHKKKKSSWPPSGHTCN